MNMIIDGVEYLFHYTSIDKLALILKNRTIRFNSLSKMDDLQEKKTEDLATIANFFYVSSWTDDDEEKIPMWNMYTNLESGVRIGLPKNPFLFQGTNYYEAERLGFHFVIDEKVIINEQSRVNTFLDLVKLMNSGIFSIAAWNGDILIKVKYTDDMTYLEPKVANVSETAYNIDYSKIGRYKNKYWEFQREWRYLISFFPIQLTPNTEEFHRNLNKMILRLLNDKLAAPFDHYDMSISEEAMNRIIITPSPKMTEGNRVLLETLLNKFNIRNNYTESSLLGLI